MKLTSRGRDSAKLELQMTSMIDCVFLLLIFFMVTASFSLTERELDSAIKVRRAALSSAASDLQPAVVEVVRGTGGSYIYKIGGREMTELEELTDVLRRFDNKLDGAIVRLAELDAALKGASRVSNELELERALLEITAAREPVG